MDKNAARERASALQLVGSAALMYFYSRSTSLSLSAAPKGLTGCSFKFTWDLHTTYILIYGGLWCWLPGATPLRHSLARSFHSCAPNSSPSTRGRGPAPTHGSSVARAAGAEAAASSSKALGEASRGGRRYVQLLKLLKLSSGRSSGSSMDFCSIPKLSKFSRCLALSCRSCSSSEPPRDRNWSSVSDSFEAQRSAVSLTSFSTPGAQGRSTRRSGHGRKGSRASHWLSGGS